MPTNETRRAILVLGASGTLGRAIVGRLCEAVNPPLIIGTFHHNRAVALSLRGQNDVFWRRLDAGDETQMRALWHELPRTLARENAMLSSVVWAIGVARDGLLVRTTHANWEHSQRTNLDGAFLTIRAALRYLPRGGRVVLLASRVGETGAVGQSAYAAHKAALLALCKSAAREGGPHDIAVNAVCPAFVASAMTRDVGCGMLEKQRARDAFGALGNAATTAETVRWLLSKAATGISGQVWHADARLD